MRISDWSSDVCSSDLAGIVLLDWSLGRRADGTFHATVPARDFALDLRFAPTQSVMLNGDKGYSRKGPRPAQASYYYSVPQLAVTRSEEHTSELQSLMRISYAVFCLKKKNDRTSTNKSSRRQHR